MIEAPAPVAEVPAPLLAASKTRRTRWLLPAILSAALVGALTFAVVQTVSLSGVNEELVAARGTVSDLRVTVRGLEGDLQVAEGTIDSLESQVSEQDAQLASCSVANRFSLKADQAFHDAVGQIMPAVFGGSDYAFDSALARYRSFANKWADAANACEGAQLYSFGNV